MRYQKPPLPIPDQIALLESRGLVVADPSKAAHYLSNISYYRHPFVLESWIRSFSNIRNICAHHGRLWNRILAQPPKLPQHTHFAWLQTPNPDVHKLFIPLSCILYVLNIISPGHHWKDHFKKLLSEYPSIKTSDMGFPPNWQNEPLWQ